MAIEWLDVSRYADTHGYHEDYHRDMWPWRDWVIRALNDNMPFDQFTIEQLAGDLLPQATPQQVVATGFNRNHGVTASGISEEYRVEYVLDRVRTTATAWMGLTLSCAQCHDHKYDPFSQQDFYRFFAYFNSVTDRGVENRAGNVDPLISIVPLDQQSVESTLREAIKRLESRLRTIVDQADEVVARWEDRRKASRPSPARVSDAGLVMRCRLDEGSGKEFSVTDSVRSTFNGQVEWVKGRLGGAAKLGGQAHAELGDLADFDRTDAFSYGAWVRGADSGAIVSRMSDADAYRGWDVFLTGGFIEVHLVHSWPANAIHVKSTARLDSADWHHVFVTYDGSSQAKGVWLYVDGKRFEVKATRDSLTRSIRVPGGLQLGRRNPSGRFNGALDDVRIYSRALSAIEVQALAGSDGLGELLAIRRSKRTPQQQEALKRGYLALYDTRFRNLQSRLGQRRRELTSSRKNRPTVMVMQDLAKPRQSFVLMRGQYDQPGDAVSPGVPEILPPLPPGAAANRLGLARWLVDPSHPLTARVAVNRTWQTLFGRGLVATSEDLGTQGELPSHPRLLDWLAREYICGGWDTKSLLRRLVMSATYRQSSATHREGWLRDPENRLLSRGARYRLKAELIRDAALSVSGLLVERLGGPSVKPYQPGGLWKETSNRPYVQGSGASLYRRSLYTYWKRSVPPPNMFALDAPTRETCTTRRQVTNTPLMALVLMNDPTFVEAARVLASRALNEAADGDRARLEALFVRITARPPIAAETDTLVRLLGDQRDRYSKRPDAARSLVGVGASPPPEEAGGSGVKELAAWTVVCSVLLNTDEVITRE